MNNNPFMNRNHNPNGEYIRFGNVVSVEGGNYRVIWDGESQALDTVYARISSYIPEAGDRVIGIFRAENYTILGKVVTGC